MNKNKGLYLGTELNGKWWKRYKKNKMFARGSGEFWLDDENFYFHRFLTTDPITISLQKVIEIKIGKCHAGRWQWGNAIVKLIWKEGDDELSSGFVVAKNSKETEKIKEDLKERSKHQS